MATLRIIGSFLLSLAVASCGGGGGGGSDSGGRTDAAAAGTAPLTAIRIAGTVSESATVTVNDVTDDDAVTDTAFSVRFPCDGSAPPRGLAVDDGAATPTTVHAFTLSAVDGAALTTTRTLAITINP
jgi:hypothetical protein